MVNIADRWGLNEEFFWLRGRQPESLIRYDEQHGVWHVYGYPEIVKILSDAETFTSDSTKLLPDAEAGKEYSEGDLSQMVGPEHRNLRKQADRMFLPKVLKRLEDRLVKDANDLLDAVAGRDGFEMVKDFADPLSGNLFCELLGVPSSDRELFRLLEKSLDSTVQIATVPQEDAAEGYVTSQVAHLKPLRDYLTEHIIERRKRPREDLLTVIVTMKRLDGSRLTDNEAVNFAMVMLGAGYLTGTVLIGNAMLCLDHHPEADKRVRADRSLIPSMIEESLRWLTPTAATYRATTREVEIAGQVVPKDQLLMLWLAVANRDPRQFPDPDVFDVTRENNAQLAFGRGSHYCVGAPMARMQGRIAFNVLMDRYPVLRTDPDDPPRFFASPDFIGLQSLPILTS